MIHPSLVGRWPFVAFAFLPSLFACSRSDAPQLASPSHVDAALLANGAHVVHSRFETDRDSLAFVFDVSPPVESTPAVRWLDGTDTERAVDVLRDGDRYVAFLPALAPLGDGRLLIEINDPKTGFPEFHTANLARRAHVGDRPAARPSRDGRFQVFSQPDGVSSSLAFAIGGSEQPLGALPPDVRADEVRGTYSLALDSDDRLDGWMFTIAFDDADGTPAVYFLPERADVWQLLEGNVLEEHHLVSAGLPGPGTFLIVGVRS